jgi:dGTPase
MPSGTFPALVGRDPGLINGYVTGTRLGRDAHLRLSTPHLTQIALLKELTRVFVVEAPALATQQHGQRRIVQDLFQTYAAALRSASKDDKPDAARLTATLFPTRVADEVERVVAKGARRNELCRIVADTIAGMTEAQALSIHHRLMGIEFGALVDPAVS